MAADAVQLSAEVLARLEETVNSSTIVGSRYTAQANGEVDTEAL